MSSASALSVILPTINEAANLQTLVPALLDELPAIVELLVVDDGSTDGTLELIRELGASDPRVRVLERRGRPCLTAALQAGIDGTSAPLVGWMDADWSITPGDLARLHEVVARGSAELAIASRFARRGRIKGQTQDGLLGRLKALVDLGDTEDSWLGVALSWGLNGVILPLLLGEGVHDYTSGVIVADRAALSAIELRGDHGEYFIDLLVRAKRAGFRIEELAYHVQPRRHGRSKTADNLADWQRRGRRYLAAAWRLRRRR